MRGLAAFAVVLYHVREDLYIGWNNLKINLNATWFDELTGILSTPASFFGSAVILFFLISGFCIGLPYMGNQARKFDLGEYTVRRIVRLYPPYLAAILLSYLIEVILFHINNENISSSKVYLSNILMVHNYTTGYLPINGVFWTLPVELELYIAFPLILILIKKWGIKATVLVTGVASFTALIFYIIGYKWLGENFMVYWLVWTSGAVLSKFYVEGKLGKPSNLMLVTGLISLAIGLFGKVKDIFWVNFSLFWGYFFLTVLWLGISTEAKWSSRLSLKITKCLTLLGTCSYSLYLIHKPIFRLLGVLWVKYFGEKPTNFIIPVLFSILIVPLAWWFYTLVEAPSHKWAKQIAYKLKQRLNPTIVKETVY